MSVFSEPLKIALVLFPILAVFLTTPYMIYEYHKRGSINTFRTVVVFAFIYYLLNAYFLVILPLPDPGSVHTSYAEMIQPYPFMFIKDLIKDSVFVLGNKETYVAALTQPVFTQVLFNIILTIPFGMFLRYYFKFSFKKTILASLCLSLFFELSQLSGLFFIYSGPYRLFDVDDLLLNTLGGVIGYGLAPTLELFFPSREHIDERTRQSASRVSFIKRVFIFVLDLSAIKVLVSLVSIIPFLDGSITEFFVFMAYFIISYQRYSGQTIVSKFLKVRLVSNHDELTQQQMVLRPLLVYIFVYKQAFLTTIFDKLLVVANNPTFVLVYLGIIVVIYLFGIGYLISVIVRKTPLLFYDTLTNTRLISAFEEDDYENH